MNARWSQPRTHAAARSRGVALACVSRERRSALELGARFVETTELEQEVSPARSAGGGSRRATARSRAARRARGPPPARRPSRSRPRHSAPRLGTARARRAPRRARRAASRSHPESAPARVTRRDRRLQRVHPARPAERLGTFERRKTATDEDDIPSAWSLARRAGPALPWVLFVHVRATPGFP